MTEDFMALTLDIWDIPPESAKHVGHPAPFPVELPEQLIRLYTFKYDLILDPFMGSGSALVAAARLERRFIGYDLEPKYVEIARQRVHDALAINSAPIPRQPQKSNTITSKEPDLADATEQFEDFQSRATKEGKAAQKLAEDILQKAGFGIEERNQRIRKTGVTVNFVAKDKKGMSWFFDVTGAFKSHRGGLLCTDTVWKSLGRAFALNNTLNDDEYIPLVFLTSHLPKRPGEGDTALRAAGPNAFFDAIEMLSEESLDRLKFYAEGGRTNCPITGFWTQQDLDKRKSLE
jgi:hypothetical protein